MAAFVCSAVMRHWNEGRKFVLAVAQAPEWQFAAGIVKFRTATNRDSSLSPGGSLKTLLSSCI